MSQPSSPKFSTVARSVLPAMAVLIAGVVGAYLVYDNYLSGRSDAQQVIGFEPAAGASENNTASSLPSAAAAKVDGQNMTAKDTAVTGKPAAVKAAESDETGAGNKLVEKAVSGGTVQAPYTQEGEDSGQDAPTYASGAAGTMTPPTAP